MMEIAVKTAARFSQFALAASLLAGAASAAGPGSGVALFDKLLACRDLPDTARLACYDTQVNALDAAEKKKDVVVLDREQVRETRRSLFGFPLPNINLFGGGGGAKGDAIEKAEKAADISELDSTVASARRLQDGWSIVLTKDGGVWEALGRIPFDPKAGDPVHIGKAAMGSYLGRIGNNRGVRFRRVG